MTCAIPNDFPHHPYTRMSQAIMPDLECINILENHFIRNMWNRFYVCVVQSRRYGRYSFYNIIAISVSLCDDERFFIILFMSHDV
jgi:hypothetical protein